MSEILEPRDLAQLRVVSPAIRDAVAATGRKVQEPVDTDDESEPDD